MDKIPVLIFFLITITTTKWGGVNGKIIQALQAHMWNKSFQIVPESNTTHGSNEAWGDSTFNNDNDNVDDDDPKKSCEDFNGDACECAIRGCDYHVDGGNQCIPSQKYCDSKQFWPGECRRESSFYSVGGVICLNDIQDGDCRRDRDTLSNYAINLNGWKYTDKNNIKYNEHNATMSHDPSQVTFFKNASDYGTSVCKKEGRGDVINIQNLRKDLTTLDQKYILHSYIEGIGRTTSENDGTRCLKFEIPLQEDGIFELNIKVFEAEHFHQNGRRFNVMLNGKVIFPEVSIFDLANKQCIAIDLMMNFVIEHNQQVITMSGFKPMDLIKHGSTELKLCRSECGEPVLDPSFIASSFSVTRFMKKACRSDL